ncbi:hypothetical protein HRW14_34410 [Streptomyces lunaelactis]|uniref:hypothetical protein n=1 Tax=Streptomyces lunaelactis TaxID=1535768 RepID=UPI001584CDE6|nr:hypothetical protein [Streptomyces lunaelactis]NUK27934.1 hypothetical protein [Streptomyces lunaelactis]NUK39254.1 hypothetical protein [Streptomyces lunaelactis]NUK43497.1 hypothetical protein [Streptomyces lunaelactis]NUK55253.1 hypothetical protein [Streptomyces lunaelactis]NUK69313.1 hypothetical protein [Streptomyces lunaelactis]
MHEAEPEAASAYDFLPTGSWGEREARLAALKEGSGGLMAEFPPEPLPERLPLPEAEPMRMPEPMPEPAEAPGPREEREEPGASSAP